MELGKGVSFENMYIWPVKPSSYNCTEYWMNKFRLDESDLLDLPE